MQHTQTFEHPELGTVSFIDNRQQVESALAQPRDIRITEYHDAPRWLVDQVGEDSVREAIAIDIRINQTGSPIGSAKNLKF